ncbi:hypothetical protein DdX_00838 [Ditylenchus destructor]|uniref:Uncharacterized protein n=1 Tax=Ditylenchus destructor TaxID=166010 RepID=A0AAD4NI55_9BILA|nr:hypothetical protein DdX_00838 [Ditylenchus destructor]
MTNASSSSDSDDIEHVEQPSAATEPTTSSSLSGVPPPIPPPIPPKIPPPPSEHPPPYTPFGGQTTTLLPQSERRSQSAANTRVSRAIQPPGFRKYLQYFTKRNLLIAGGTLLALLIIVQVFRWYLANDEEANTKRPLKGTKLLEHKVIPLGAYKSKGERISYDENSDSIILSEYVPQEHMLKCESLKPDEYLEGFMYTSHNMSDIYSDCIRFANEVTCCATAPHSRHHKTDCFLQQQGEVIHSVAVKYDFMPTWQSLADDEYLLLVYNRQRHAVLDLKNRRLYKIEENRLPHGFVSVAFFFPMDTNEELDELVRSGEEFLICEYLKSNVGDYILKEEQCRSTSFNVEFELPKVQFCSNPLYTAVVQYGHVQGEADLTWHLRVKYDSSHVVYSAADTLAATADQLVIDCNDNELDIFVLGTHELYEIKTILPNLRSEHFIQPRRF